MVNNKKSYNKKNVAGPKSKTIHRRMLQDHYAIVLKKYKHLLPDAEPVVKVRPLSFKASHHTGEPYRLPSDVDLIRDSAAFYDILGAIFQNLDVYDKYKAISVCKLWNRAGKEESAWRKIILRNRSLTNLKPLERLILKHETEILDFKGVTVIESANQYDFCRLSSVRTLIFSETDDLFVTKLLRGCNELEHISIFDEDLEVLKETSSTLKTILAPIGIIQEGIDKTLKRFYDLEKLQVLTVDPDSYNFVGLLLSLKELRLTHLHVTEDIQNFIENIPNIEYMSFNPVYNSSNVYDGDVNRKFVEALKRCPSLKKLEWVTYEEVVIVEKKEEEPIEEAEIINKETAELMQTDNVDEKPDHAESVLPPDPVSELLEKQVEKDVSEPHPTNQMVSSETSEPVPEHSLQTQQNEEAMDVDGSNNALR